MINNRFIIKRKLGEGRSKVFLCSDSDNPEIDYAIKILPETADVNEIKIFRNEFFVLQKLNHPNIIASYDEGVVVKTDDAGIKTGSRFIILDYFPGTELLNYKHLNNEQNLKIILKQISTALYYLHQSNYIYYDLKPENILISETDGKPVIKLIDMGFAHHLFSTDEYISRGTKEYIAPEILKKEPHNHQVDFYSLGIMLYRIIYGKFPFKSESELEIYKEHIEREYEFPESNFSSDFIEITKKLLEKNPVNRFDNALEISGVIKADIDKDIIKYFTPANLFTDREKIISDISSYLEENPNKEIVIISGAEGSGKTSLMYEIYSDYEKIILISSAGRGNKIVFIHLLLKKIIYSEYIYPFLNNELIEEAELILSGNSDNLIDSLKSILIKISGDIKFTIIIDDFNLLDEFTLDVFREILPILQVNDINIILTERTDHPSASEKILNKAIVINLPPFTENDLNIYLDEALATFFPKDQLKKMIVKYADLLPGSVINFIRDLILLNVIIFTPDGPEIVEDENTEKLLESSHEEIFSLRFSLLAKDEIKIAQFISFFENLPEIEIIASFNSMPVEHLYDVIKKLEEKNILQVTNIINTLDFTSDSLKKYIYSTIDDKEIYHLKIAEYISENFRSFNKNELSRQYELAKDFISSYEILSEEIDAAEELSAYSYKKNLLNHLLKLPLSEDYKFELKRKLSFTLYKLNDAKSALKMIEYLLLRTEEEKIKNELLILKGNCLIELGELEEGKILLEQLVKKISDEEKKQKLLVEIAYAEFDLGKYEVAKDICYEIINSTDSSYEEKGKCYNLLGLIDTYLDSNFDGALSNFQKGLEKYSAANLISNIAKIEVNIGNTCFWQGDFTNAEKHWNIAIQSNQSIGNLDQEAKTLLSFGIFYYNRSNFENAIEKYTRAYNIFTSNGNRNGQGLALSNLGESYLSSSKYQNAHESLKKAKIIFNKMLNIEEEAEVIFLLGKLFFILGDFDQLKNSIYELKLLSKENILPERYKSNLKFLELLELNTDGGNIINLDFFENVSRKFKEQNEGLFFTEGYAILCEKLIECKMYKYAYTILNDSKFEETCNQTFLYKAHKNYLLSIISFMNNVFKLQPAIEYLEKAHNLIKDEFITELTWKVLFSLGEHYFNRGNLKKAHEYFLYSKEVIKFLSNNIIDDKLRSIYLSKPERKSVFEKIKIMQFVN